MRNNLDGIICKATTVTHTKWIDRNLLHKETSFVCYTSSVLIRTHKKSAPPKQKHFFQVQTKRPRFWRFDQVRNL